MSFTLRAHAKINLSLKILSKRLDGFHEIETTMQSISLSDLITLTPSDKITLQCDNLELDNQKNLSYQAALLLRDEFSVQEGVSIKLEKKIPLAAGLAGGSADAAATIIGLNRLWGLDLSVSQMLSLGAKLGSDVPFCIMGGSCLCRGRGELVERMKSEEDLSQVLLVVPDLEIKSSWAYQTWDKLSIAPLSRNDLEAVAIKYYPEIGEIKERLKELGALKAMMSGSGPSIFAIFNDSGLLQKAVFEMRKNYKRVFEVYSVSEGVSFN